MAPSADSLEGVRILTEAEIQERLYGQYLGGRGKRAVSPSAVAPISRPSEESPVARPQPVWTGAEILAGELKVLRQELILLRKERERLAAELARCKTTPSPAGERQDSIPGKSEGSAGWLFFSTVAAGVVLVVGIGYPLGERLLQASPVISAEPTPYTVQVAVYDARTKAEDAVARLKGLDYPAFLIASARRDGRSRYRVYLGEFVTQEEANQERLRLAGDPRFCAYSDAFVRFR